MTSQEALDTAARMGRRAGQSFVDTGIWPRNPFRSAAVSDLAVAWRDGVFEVVGPVVAPRPAPRS